MKQLDKPNWKRRQERKKTFWLGLLCAVLAVAVLVGGSVFFWQSSSNEVESADRGSTVLVKAGDDFQAALDKAKPGDTILLEARATFRGAFKLPNKPGKEFITIRTSAKDSQLPPPDTRIDPKKHRDALPKIISSGVEPAIYAANGAHHYRFIGIEFGPTRDGLYNIIQIGSTEETSIEQLPHHIEFDRVYLYGDPKFGQRRGIAANGRFMKISNSYFADFKREGEESQAIAIWATDGHIEIVNNYMEAAAEQILFGGAENKMGLVPGNCIIRSNWLNKPLAWRNEKWTVKNFFEIKSGRRIKFDNNLMTNNWAQAQEGTGVLFRTGTDSGEQAVVEDIEFTNNIMRSSGSAINIFGGEGKGGRNLTIRNNLFTDISAKKYDVRGFFIMSTTFDNVVIENNTVIHDGSIAIAYGEPVTNFVFRNNIVFNNEYGFFGDGTGVGKTAINKYFPKAVISNNIIVGGDEADYGNKNYYPVSLQQLRFVNAETGDYRLLPDNRQFKRLFEDQSIGANLDPATVGGK
jgi:hypothetical protein